MILKRGGLVYGSLLSIWLILLGWQAAEHVRVRHSARAALVERAKDISNTLGLVMRSQRFFGIISKERLESVLKELVRQGELNSISLLNADQEVVASAGEPIELPPKSGLIGGEHWDAQTVTLVNLVDLGTNVTRDLERTNLAIVIPSRDIFGAMRTNRPPPAPPDEGMDPAGDEPPRHHWRRHGTNDINSFVRPFWMKEDEYNNIIQKQGVHSFILVLPTQSLAPVINRDLWLRGFISLLATIAVTGSGLAWRNLAKSADLQIRLVRASELNAHLRDMNLAAAGLAHETRNPLNIIRGLAQMISRQPDATSEVRSRSREIVDEADRVAAQLNEFINYSRPREVRRTATKVTAVLAEVVRALNYDVEEKHVRVQVQAEPFEVEADEQLLRQALFNLVLNAIQAVPEQGEIIIRSARQGGEAVVEVADNGPGVAPEHRAEIFKPYFTTHSRGTGLGLAVVQQIVLAHGWEIEYRDNAPRGAVFRIARLKLKPNT